MAARKKLATKNKPKSQSAKTATHGLSWARICLVVVLGAFVLVFTAAIVLYAIRGQLNLTGDYVLNTRAAEVDATATREQGKVVLRDENYGKELRSFLAADAKRNLDISDSCAPLHYKVTHATTDGQQLKLNYGCEEPNAHMFLVHDAGGWHGISPTNQFDSFGMPRCDHVGAHSVSREIAPVCWNGAMDGSDITYVVR